MRHSRRPRGGRLVVAAAFLVLLASSSTAQIRHPGQPLAGRVDLAPPVLALPAPDVSRLLAEDALAGPQAPGPLRFGVMVPAPYTFEDLAAWEVEEQGERRVARLRIDAPGAYSLGVEFSAWELPEGGQLFLYDEGLQHVFGAYTAANRIPTGEFVVEPFPGGSVILEYSQPLAVERPPHIELRGVIYDYRDVFALEEALDETDDGGFLGGCPLVDVNCPEGAPFPLQKRATVRTVFGGGLCSGVLINNSANDGTPFLYTANHCGTGSAVVVRFNYQRPGCSSGSAPTNQNVSGAVLLASDQDTDGRLLRLTSTIPDSYEPYYAGWSRSSADSSFSFAVSMHHPGGGVKKISIDQNGAFKSTGNFIGIGFVKVWSVTFDVGATEGGSSGGPLFDQNGRIRGTLTGGPSSPCNVSLYGRFHDFWNETSISNHLDPLGLNPTFIAGFDPFADLAPATALSLSPGTGPAGGFTAVTIDGSGFDGVSAVTFGGNPAFSISVLDDTTLVATTGPGGSAGATVDVSVTDGFGTSTLVDAFQFVADPAPQVTGIEPADGIVDGGTVVTVQGPSLVGVSEVRFGGVAGSALTFLGPGELRVTTPAVAATGPVDVTVVGNGTVVLPGAYTYFNPGSFTPFGTGLAGVLGIPNLTGFGDLLPGGSGFTLSTTGAKPGGFGLMFVSAAEAAVPFYGGTLYTFPIEFDVPLGVGLFGSLSLPVLIDPSIPGGIEVYVQQAFADDGAIFGVSLSNAMKLRLAEN